MAKKKSNDVFNHFGTPFPIDPNLDDAIRRVVSDVLSGMTAQVPGSPITYSINIRVDENGVPSVSQPAPGKDAKASLEPDDARTPLVEVVERPRSITVIAEVPGADRNSLWVRAAPKRLEIRSAADGKPGMRANVINLPVLINPATASARFLNGILEVNVAKGSGPAAARSVKVE